MFNWIIIKYKSGANPYIVKTEKEFKRIMRKYKDNIKQTNGKFYIVNDLIKEE